MVGVQFDLDARRVPGHRLVHRIVEYLGHQMVQRAFVGPTDIHAGTFAHRLQTLQHFDRRGVIRLGGAGKQVIGHWVLDS